MFFDRFIELFLWIYLTFTQFYYDTDKELEKEWFRKISDKIWYMPPSWLFFPMWIILYSLMTVAIFSYWIDDDTIQHYRVIIIVLYITNVLMNKLWSITFFRDRDFSSALFINCFVFITIIIVIVLMALDGAWLSFGLLIPYALWLIYTNILNLSVVNIVYYKDV